MAKLSLAKLAENEIKKHEMRGIIGGDVAQCGCVCTCTCGDITNAKYSEGGSVTTPKNNSYDPGMWDFMYDMMEYGVKGMKAGACYFYGFFVKTALKFFSF